MSRGTCCEGDVADGSSIVRRNVVWQLVDAQIQQPAAVRRPGAHIIGPGEMEALSPVRHCVHLCGSPLSINAPEHWAVDSVSAESDGANTQMLALNLRCAARQGSGDSAPRRLAQAMLAHVATSCARVFSQA